MAELFASGRIVVFILGVVVVEAIVLVFYWQRSGRGVAPADLAFSLLAGAFLLMAVRAALLQAAWPVVAAWLTAALLAHLGDLVRRWR